VIGLVLSLSERPGLSYDWKLFLATGICGGFTTFSAFSIESFSMLRNGQYSSALIYILASVLLGVMFTLIGYLIPRLV
jgi:fluoride exporter